jgi:Holliday junction resolvase RusA-like endonuclease
VANLNPPIIELDLPLAPATNNLYFIRRGRKVLSDAGREYKAAVARILNSGFTHEFIPPKTNLCFAATFYIPKSVFYRRDLDNCLKCTIDSIFQGFKAMGGDVNDNRITEIHTVKKLALKEDLTGCCTVEISLANEAINAKT